MNDSIKTLEMNFGSVKNTEPVYKWMTKNPLSLKKTSMLKEAVQIMDEHKIDGLPVLQHQKLIGLVTKTRIVRSLLDGSTGETAVEEVMKREIIAIGPEDTISKAWHIKVGRLPVVDDTGALIGILTKTDILHSYFYHLSQLQETVHTAETLSTILETAYEGIAVIDKNGTVLEFNEAYCRFVGKQRDEVMGKHVTDVIENTRLHIVAKTGIEERGFIQRIQGQDMVVHRIPIVKENEVVGAIGMLIFHGVSELYNILGRMQELSRKVTEQTLPDASVDAEETSYMDIIGVSEEISAVKRLAKKAARTPSTVLITGGSGTGKEMFAKAIHQSSPFAEGPFVSVNCAAIPEHLLEAELFGYEEGAFTGARKGGKPGKFEQAHKGTLFLDEIGDMPALMQSKILRALQERTVERVGGSTSQRIDVRIIAATNRPLEQMVQDGTFREDLYYRLNIIRLEIPPLRKRRRDIPVLLEHHLQSFCQAFKLEPMEFSDKAMQLLKNYEWPGNVRELVNTVEMLVSLGEDRVITETEIPARFHQSHVKTEGKQERLETPEQGNLLDELKQNVKQQERERILQVLKETAGNKSAAARKLGIQRSTLYEKLKKLQ
ncbi:sigma 54-interacting transcriptional regulator [Fictibacillus enclensis]|uniref:sigma 54-interacting transcriptional regulator n=1 Tax=Fictibacillus enclensis TaxID=1017270 RepID=UPI0025A122F8|nr:sigma 54-interacting transcriptional regulator [Fictibacillus enclensis]MDM5198253.1 sigma 54-interacting transcriptional regulator [Fictibacillus enclensis]